MVLIIIGIIMLALLCEEKKIGEELIKHIVNYRFRQKKNTIFAVCGGVGEGKSYTALKIAEMIQPDFSPKEQIVYNPQQFLEIMNKVKEKGYKVVILDEAHVTVPAKTWYSFTNLAMSFVTSTFRQVHPIVIIIVTPNVNWVEKSIREMVNYYAVVERTYDGPIIMKLYQIGFNYFNIRDQLPYLKKIRFGWKGEVKVLRYILVGLPSKRIIDEYEEISVYFKKKLIERELERVLEGLERKGRITGRLEKISSMLQENKELLESLLKDKEEMKLKRLEIKKLFKLSPEEINVLEDMLKRKVITNA